MRFLHSYNIRFMFPQNLFDVAYDEEKNETKITTKPLKDSAFNNFLDCMMNFIHYVMEYEFPGNVVEKGGFYWRGVPNRYISKDLPTKKGDYFKFEDEENNKVKMFRVLMQSSKMTSETLDEMSNIPLSEIYVFKEGSSKAYPILETELIPEPELTPKSEL